MSIADPFLDILPQPDRTSLLLVLLSLVLEHLIDFLVDLIGVGQVYIPSEYHVPSAPCTLPGIRPFLLRKARLADDTSATRCEEPLLLLIADDTGVLVHCFEEVVLRVWCHLELPARASFICRISAGLPHLGLSRYYQVLSSSLLRVLVCQVLSEEVA